MKLYCPRCGGLCEDELAAPGANTACSSCGQIFQVPAPVAALRRASDKEQYRRCRKCGARNSAVSKWCLSCRAPMATFSTTGVGRRVERRSTSNSTPIVIAIVATAVLIVGGLIAYLEFGRARHQEDVRSGVESLDRAIRTSREIKQGQSWQEARRKTIALFDSLSVNEQAGFLLTFRNSAERSAKLNAPNKEALEIRLRQIAALERELRNRRKRR